MAPWIISHFPEHLHYVEPCFGAGNVLLRKKRSKLETVGDINGRLVNFFRVLRDRPAELIEAVELTPYAEEVYDLAFEPAGDPLEDARRFFFTCWGSYGGGPARRGFRRRWKPTNRGTSFAEDVINHDLRAVAERLRNVQVLQMDALEMIRRVGHVEGALVYLDPPYPLEVRGTGRKYGQFEVDEQFHRDAAQLLQGIAGYAVVSGMVCDLYREIYGDRGWRRVDKKHGVVRGGRGVESLWLSPRTVKALGVCCGRPKGGTLGLS